MAASAQAVELGADREALARGDRGYVETVLTGTTVERIPVTFLGTFENYAGPGYDLFLIRLEGEVGERVGVAAGMSGSPVYFDGRLIGALSYSIGFLPKDPVAGVTPIEDLLGSRRVAARAGKLSGEVRRIATPVHTVGLAEGARRWLEEQWPYEGLRLVAGGAGGRVEGELPALGPASPVGVALVRGDVDIAATGTVTWVDGDAVYAFGHPFLGQGAVEFPMLEAEVLHTMADLGGSFKLAEVGRTVGAITDDRLSAIVGELGAVARTIPVTVRVSGADYEPRDFSYEIARGNALTPVLAATVVGNSLFTDLGYDVGQTLLAEGRIALVGRESIPFEVSASGPPASAGAAVSEIAQHVRFLLAQLGGNPIEPVAVESIELDVRAASEARGYRVVNLIYDRGARRPGERLEIDVVLESFRGEQRRERLALTIPRDAEPGASYRVAVGPPGQIETALGRPLARRLQSADQVGEIVEVLGELQADHRLLAVLFESTAGGVVRDGRAWESLPPTAARLLATARTESRSTRSLVRAVDRSERTLDGPIEGGLALRIRIEAGEERP